MGVISRLFGKKTVKTIEMTQAIPVITPEVMEEIKGEVVVPVDLPEGEIVPLEDGILNVDDPVVIQKFKHNLEVLISRTKEKGEIQKFALIREDDFLPKDWVWRASSGYTGISKNCLSLSSDVRLLYALNNIGKLNIVNGIMMPVSNEIEQQALKSIDINTAKVEMPVHFRSTKHFTMNVPLSFSGTYNGVSVDRNFIVIDSPDNFLKSGYAYSVAYYDAYLDVAHEGLKVSKDGIVLMNKKKYEALKDNEELMKQLSERKLIIFEGDEGLAVCMVLSAMGVLPSQVGSIYADYDEELRQIIDESIRNLANRYSLLFNQSHFASKKENGHFTSFMDDQHMEYKLAINEFAQFLQSKFPEHSKLISATTVDNQFYSSDIVKAIGYEKLLDAINEYNELVEKRFVERYRSYSEERDNFSPEIHDIFVTTVNLIDDFYANKGFADEEYSVVNRMEKLIKVFFHSTVVAEQLQAAKAIIEYMKDKQKALEENDGLKM